MSWTNGDHGTGPKGEEQRRAAAVEDCCRRVRQGESLESCLAGYPPQYREELARLVPLSGRLAKLAGNPSPEFQARLQRRILEEVAEARQCRSRGPLARVKQAFSPLVALLLPGGAMVPARALGIALIALIVLAASGIGAVQAAEDSLPDSPLYHVKTAREWVETATARDQQAKLNVEIRQIGKRGMELAAAVRAGKPRPVLAVLVNRLGIVTKQMVDHAIAMQGQGAPQAVPRALTVIRAMQNQTDQLLAETGPDERRPLLRLRHGLDEQEARLLAAH